MQEGCQRQPWLLASDFLRTYGVFAAGPHARVKCRKSSNDRWRCEHGWQAYTFSPRNTHTSACQFRHRALWANGDSLDASPILSVRRCPWTSAHKLIQAKASYPHLAPESIRSGRNVSRSNSIRRALIPIIPPLPRCLACKLISKG